MKAKRGMTGMEVRGSAGELCMTWGAEPLSAWTKACAKHPALRSTCTFLSPARYLRSQLVIQPKYQRKLED